MTVSSGNHLVGQAHEAGDQGMLLRVENAAVVVLLDFKGVGGDNIGVPVIIHDARIYACMGGVHFESKRRRGTETWL